MNDDDIIREILLNQAAAKPINWNNPDFVRCPVCGRAIMKQFLCNCHIVEERPKIKNAIL